MVPDKQQKVEIYIMNGIIHRLHRLLAMLIGLSNFDSHKTQAVDTTAYNYVFSYVGF